MTRSKIESVRVGELELMEKAFLIWKIIRLEQTLDLIESTTSVRLQDESYREEMLKHKEDR